jgi:hypothetical protein
VPPAYRALDFSTTTGTADLVLSGTSATGYQTFGAAGLDGATVDYVVEALNADGSQQGTWEKGQGVYTHATKTLTRATVQASSAGGAKVTLPAGNKRVFVPPPQQGDQGAKGDKGDTGNTGATGAAGADGATWRSGSGAPANSLGVNGDYYLDTATGDVYKKAAGTYSVVGNIKGPTGATGSQGATGNTGATGATGAGGLGAVGHRLTGDPAAPFPGTQNGLTTLYFVPFQASNLPLYHSTTGEAAYGDVPSLGVLLGTLTASLGYDVFCLADFGTPSSVASLTHEMTFAANVGWQTGAWVRVVAGGGGLTAGTDYWYGRTAANKGFFYGSLSDALSDANRVAITAAPADATLLGVSLEVLAWASATARATAVTFQTRGYRKSGDRTRLLVGSFYTTGTTTTEQSATKNFVSNFYNRRARNMARYETAGSWAGDGTGNWRKWNNSATNRLEWFECWDQEPHKVDFIASGAGSNPPYLGIGLDSATAPSGRWGFSALAGGPYISQAKPRLGVGYHYAQALEKAGAGVTFYGVSAGDVQFGIEGEVMA